MPVPFVTADAGAPISALGQQLFAVANKLAGFTRDGQ
jgi:hypothetical protein